MALTLAEEVEPCWSCLCRIFFVRMWKIATCISQVTILQESINLQSRVSIRRFDFVILCSWNRNYCIKGFQPYIFKASDWSFAGLKLVSLVNTDLRTPWKLRSASSKLNLMLVNNTTPWNHIKDKQFLFYITPNDKKYW